MNDIRENKPYSVNQIKTEKPNIPRTETAMSGFIAGSMNAAHNKPIHFKQVMAGERIKQYSLQANFKLLTPKTVSFQNLYVTFYSYFVPNSRVWKNAEKFTAQKGGTSETKIEEIPNYGGKTIPRIHDNDPDLSDNVTNLCNTTLWRDSYVSAYIPRVGWNDTYDQYDTQYNVTLPKGSILPLRGFKAIYNDFLRNKEYDAKLTEYDDDTVSETEWLSYMPVNNKKLVTCLMRAKMPDSYYSNYRTEIQGFETPLPEGSTDVNLVEWVQFENKIAEVRSQAQNAMKNDWDIIAEIRGSKVALEGKVQLIGKKTVNLNYAAITQSTYNTNENISDEFKVMGTQGAYSYTEMNVPLFAGFESVEEGYIHVIACVQADTVYSSAFDRLELNVNALDRYRPDMKEEKNDVLYEIECGSLGDSDGVTDLTNNKAYGFKRKYSEYFKLANVIQGDMTNRSYYGLKEGLFDFDQMYFGDRILTNGTYSFFETDRRLYIDENQGIIINKNIWKDYCDLLLNRNQAIKLPVIPISSDPYGDIADDIVINGNNQIFYVGKVHAIVDLPIDESIKKDFTTWGEH